MGGEFREILLSEIVEKVIDNRGKNPPYSDFGYEVIETGCISGKNRFPNYDLVTKYVDESTYSNWFRSGHPSKGDLLLITVGNNVGSVSIIGADRGVITQNLIGLKISSKACSEYIYYYLSQQSVFDYLQSINIGSAQPSIKVPHLLKTKITLPCVTVQRSIAHILGTLDDKIALNRQMNATLEAMAQALFKSWFVDFDPVIDNALAAGNPIPEELQARADARAALGDKRKPLPETIQKQFPSRFVFTEEMGWVPEGWQAGIFGDVAKNVRDNVQAEDVGSFPFYVGLEHIGRKQIFLTSNGAGDSIESNKSKFTENDMLFGKLRPYFHKVCLAPCGGICSTDILVFRAKRASMHSFMTLTGFTAAFVENANMRSTGTRMPRASAKDMLDYKIVIPPQQVLEPFESMIAPIWRKGLASVANGHELSKLRDTLLPKLLSGELRIPDSERQVAEAV